MFRKDNGTNKTDTYLRQTEYAKLKTNVFVLDEYAKNTGVATEKKKINIRNL